MLAEEQNVLEMFSGLRMFWQSLLQPWVTMLVTQA